MSIATNKQICLPSFDNFVQKTFPDLPAAERDWEVCLDKATGVMQFLKPLPKWAVEKPFHLTLPLPPGQPHTNTVMERHDMLISDVRGHESLFSLDVEGFEFTKHAIPLQMGKSRSNLSQGGQDSAMPNSLNDGQGQRDFQEDKALREYTEDEYLPRVESFMKNKLRADRVVAFDYTFRRAQKSDAPYRSESTGVVLRSPARNVHTDQTPESALRRLRLYFNDEVEELVKGRVQIINFWVPLFGPIQDTPLAVLDARTLTDEDLVAQDQILPHHIGEIYLVKHKPRHRWYYLNNMEPDEAILIKCFDSLLTRKARLCPHGAFEKHHTPRDARPRESLEVRCIVFHHDVPAQKTEDY
ncbi:hypothetical protein F5Y08DRAFT_324011 [Xylaria arbuscula]|nr:hypothetical protein F5Y08DRAFT_324011 [Xylaria arbuscula]